ncbi:MAG: hypothetical protein R3286_04895 [Gammaproteobacteria bacterium]|nr:hypothetical protein [Gammaproteobacteria bacterium]
MKRLVFSSASARRAVAAAALAASLSGCALNTSLIEYCCYKGEVALAYLEDVKLVTPQGKQLAFRDVYTDFSMQQGLLTKPLPIQNVEIGTVIYQSLAPVLPLYDANKNGKLEPPELTVMYIREGAIGLGHEVDHLVVDGKRANAITTSAADIGGLMKSIDAHLDTFPPASQAIFRDMERVGLDYIQRGSEGSDKQDGKWDQ